MSIQLYPSIAKIKRNGVYENLPGFVPETGSIATQQMIATSESSATAQYEHNKGEYFRLNDTLYQAIVKINVGDSIVVGTNCEVAVLGNDVTHIANSIAEYELGIATAAHATGEYFMVGETLYVATDDIAIGDSISTSTNCKKAVLANEVFDLKTATNQKFENIGYTEEPSINILNPAELEPGRITSSKSEPQHTGTYDTDYRTTGFMPVEAGKKYGFHIEHNGNVAGTAISNIWAYTSNKSALTYLGSISYNSDGLSYITAPEGAAYIRASIQTAILTQDGTVMCSEVNGTTKPPEIVPYGSEYYLDGYLKEQDLKKWTGKKWVVFGDSLTEENSRTTKHYFDYVSDVTGISTYNMGNSGSGYMNEQDLDTAFYQRISDVPTDADVITIFGSFNDNSHYNVLGTATDTGTTTIGGCINTTLDNLFEAFPLANIGIVTPTPWQGQNPTTEPNNASAYVDLIKQICNMRSIPCLDLFHCSQLRPWDSAFRALAYSKDDGNGTHPDETGHKIIAPRFQAFLDTLLLH